MKDSNISDSVWNRYLKKKYGKTYRVFRDELGVWSIRCRYGFVQPYSIANKELVAVLTYRTSRGINILIQKLQSEPALEFRISQRGDFEVSLLFNEKNINQMDRLLSFGHRRQISEEQKKILIARLKLQ